jgi:hypothetical protein
MDFFKIIEKQPQEKSHSFSSQVTDIIILVLKRKRITISKLIAILVLCFRV